MRNVLVYVIAVSTFSIIFAGNDTDSSTTESASHSILTTSWSGGSEKNFLDTTYLDLLNAHDVQIQLKPDGEPTLFNTVPGVPSMVGFFHGNNGGQSINLYENPKTKAVFGSVVDSDTNEIHQITTNAIGETEVITKNVNDFTDDGDPMVIPVAKKGFFGARSLAESPMLRSFAASLAEPRLLDSGNSIDVMVVWTKKAECKNSGLSSSCTLTLRTRENMLGKIQLAVDETNTAFALSGVDTQLRLVHAYLEDTYVESDTYTALEDLTFQFDGKMDDVHVKREKFGADVVSLWIETSSCGLGWVGPIKDYMFSVVAWNCATGYFSFGHEIAHNMGCNHDRGTENDCTDKKPNYGYRDKNSAFRDIMSYNCRSDQCDGGTSSDCSRVQRFSNTASNYNGAPIGNAQSDCASHLNSYRATVAGYFPAKTDEELVELGQFKYDALPPVVVNLDCKPKRNRCKSNSVCCSNQCQWRRCK